MPNRIIKESICTSENVDQLSAFQEIFFYRLIVNCDDYGRMDARPKILSSRLFPLKDIRAAQIEDALRALTSAELVILYEVDGKPFLQMKTWDRHQQVRAKKSKYPSPDEGICNQMLADASKCPRNPIQYESNPNPNPTDVRKRTESEIDSDFQKFWDAYPRHDTKAEARKLFGKLNPDEELLTTMLTAIEQQKKNWTDPKYIPQPRTWINQRRWEDDLPADSYPKAGQAVGKILPAQQYTQRDYSGFAEDPDDVLERAAQYME